MGNFIYGKHNTGKSLILHPKKNGFLFIFGSGNHTYFLGTFTNSAIFKMLSDNTYDSEVSISGSYPTFNLTLPKDGYYHYFVVEAN